jgi:Uma2 family endonuclease
MAPATADILSALDETQHLVLDGVSWERYEELLREVGDDAIRVTYDNGAIEIMSPLPKHEKWGARIARLIELMSYERQLTIEPLGSTTFRKKKRNKGLEPDKCFYIANAAAAREIEDEFDPAVHPAPDLAIEIDITRRSIPREPIYAALGVPELWRFQKNALTVRHLKGEAYVDATTSLSFPFLPMAKFHEYLLRLATEPTNAVLHEFGAWVRSL